MCGFIALNSQRLGEISSDDFSVLSHRGPDHTGTSENSWGIFIFNRLSIMDTSNAGHQPFKTSQIEVMCNGEIYNYSSLKKDYAWDYNSDSDCEVLLPLYMEKGIQGMVQELDGEYAFVIYDKTAKSFFAARDPLGIRPLFYGTSPSGEVLAFASEAKALIDHCFEIKAFPPGHFFQNGVFKSFRDKIIKPKYIISDEDQALNGIKSYLEQGVIKRLQSDVPVGFLLSGGLDSSLVCAIAQRHLDKPITTFAIGIETNPIDTKYARQVADYLGTDHHEVLFTEKQVKETLRELIFHLETYDITTIRAAMGMYLLCKYIKEKTDIKVVLTGEVSDELFGYKYTDFAPSPEAFQAEAVKRIEEIYMYDVLRADRSIAAHGLEARVPFSDSKFVEHVMAIDPKLKMNSTGVGKHLLRKAFEGGDYLPHDILYREKAAFSDAVGHRMVDFLKEIAEEAYGDTTYSNALKSYNHATPFTKESLMYREIFEEFFPGKSHLVVDYWMPNKEWENCDVSDPSARALPNYGKSGG